MEKVEIYGTIKRTTERAILFHDGDKSIWIPKSIAEFDDDDYGEGDTCDVTVPEWFAFQEGMI